MDEAEQPHAWGTVVEVERGSLPFALIHGEALVAVAAWALGEAEVTPVDLGTDWAALRDSDEPFVLHDSLCPMTPPDFIAECVLAAVRSDHVVVGVRPVTDTVKRVVDGHLRETVDREDLLIVASPVVLPASAVAAVDGLASWDFAELVTALAASFTVDFRQAPPAGRRVGSPEDLEVLAALTRP